MKKLDKEEWTFAFRAEYRKTSNSVALMSLTSGEMRPQDNIYVGQWDNKLASDILSKSLYTVPDIWGIVVFSALAVLVCPTLLAVSATRLASTPH